MKKRSMVTILMICLSLCCLVGCGKSEEEKAAELEAQNKATYEEAIGLLEDGKYEDGKVLLETISGYKDVSNIYCETKLSG